MTRHSINGILDHLRSRWSSNPLLRGIYFSTVSLITYPKWRTLLTKERVWLELGSGAKKGANGWVTVDLHSADICYDLRKGLPLPDGSVDRIYTSHLFEHIPYRDLIAFIHNCYRVLKNDGELSVCVPDASLFIRAYAAGEWFLAPGEGYKPAIIDTGSLLDQINYIAYMDQQHKYMFDQENLVNTLRQVPFRTVKLRSFDESIDLKRRDYQSVYASAIK